MPRAEIVVQEPGKAPERLTTDYNGRGTFVLEATEPYSIGVQKPGFYAADLKESDPALAALQASRLGHK